MHALSRIFFTLLISGISISIAGQDSGAQELKREGRGSIAGRVTLEGKPVPRVTVLLRSSERIVTVQPAPPARATTNEDGRYRFTGLAAGSYAVSTNTPAFVVAEERGQIGQPVSILDGEDAEDIDFTLKQGGVITGRIADAEGQPIIGGRVIVMPVDERGRAQETPYPSNGFKYMTDDRGVYRVYGLQPGPYKVAFGDTTDGRSMRGAGFGIITYTRAFHPDVPDEARSPTVEVAAGLEATGIDVTVGRAARTYVATGRIVDAETGQPIPDLLIGYGSLLPDGKNLGTWGAVNNITNSRGEFRIEGLPPGQFAAFVANRQQSEFYSEPASFEVDASDVSGLEIRVHRGSSIIGVAVIEGTEDAEVLAKLSKIEIRPYVASESLNAPTFAPTTIGPSGTFRISGLQPGKVRILLSNYPPIKGLFLQRLEREGVEQQEIVIGPSEQVSGVRLVIGYGTGIIQGQVKFQGAEKPPNLRMFATVRRLGGAMFSRSTYEVDPRGRFRIEGLPSGEYQVTLAINYAQLGNSRPAPAMQNVTVVNGSEAAVTLVVDLKPAGKDEEK